jgi:hypothetical protein
MQLSIYNNNLYYRYINDNITYFLMCEFCNMPFLGCSILNCPTLHKYDPSSLMRNDLKMSQFQRRKFRKLDPFSIKPNIFNLEQL